ncbi:Meiosis arrest female protein 1 [Rhynchospora pubera]|uniref:Meiosis arrest female protein 1 n=1 Tax=Rhynchospora pubera TaxID=906938 RepID=A0AAV8D4L2_9POAL|nr:Meiosis arrest female protein 1 [Rhynchospora pubera]
MSYKEKSFLSRTPSPVASKPPLSPMPSLVAQRSDPASAGPRQADSIQGPVTILWDMENCPVPSDVRPEDVAANIRLAVRAHPSITGAVTSFSAYGDFNGFPRRLREGCQRTGVKLVDVPNGRKDAADKAILVDMFLFALDNRPPCSIMLISGDVDFAPALHILGQRGYTIILAIPASVAVSTALCSAGNFVWDWPCIARGTGLVPPKNFTSRGMAPVPVAVAAPVLTPVRESAPEPSSHFESKFRAPEQVQASTSESSCHFTSKLSFDDSFDAQNDGEAIVYRGSSSRVNQVLPRELFGQPACNVSEGYYDNCSTRAQVGLVEGVYEDPVSTDQEKWWVKPGDIYGLKGQLVRLFEQSGGTLPLVKVPSEYLKLYGRHLYVAEYGACKLVHLFSKMNDAFVVIGKGQKKTICLRNTCDTENWKKCASTPIILKRENKMSCTSTPFLDEKPGSSSDEELDDEISPCSGIDAGDEYDKGMEELKYEVQELMVCYMDPVPFDDFEKLYEQRYKKQVDYTRFGVDGLRNLLEKVPDVVELLEDADTNDKFLIPRFI